jgi:hypothetical protein
VIAVLLFLAVSVVMFAGAYSLFVIGIRNGDRIGDATVAAAHPDDHGRGISFTLHNPAAQPVLIGASLRHPRLRLLGQAGRSVTAPRRTLRGKLLARQHTVVWAIPAGQTQTVIVPFSRAPGRRAELVVAIGQPDRLRVMRQRVELCSRTAGSSVSPRSGQSSARLPAREPQMDQP